MKKNTQKKIILFTTLIGTVLSLAVTSGLFYDYCFSAGHCENLYNFIELISSFFLLFPAMLFFSLITYFMHDKVFRAWRNFAFVWIPISIIWITATPETTGMLQVINKESVGIISSGLFVLIGLVVVFFSWLGNGHKK